MRQSLPDTWQFEKLGKLCEFIRGVSFSPADVLYESKEGYLPILRAGNISRDLNLLDDLIWIPATNVSEKQRLQIGDIVVCMSSGSASVVGKTAHLTSDFGGSVGAFCGIIRSNGDSTFLAHWFRSPSYFEWRNNQARGANIQNLRFSQMAEIILPLPPLDEQKRIAARLSAQMEAVAEAREAARAQLAAVEAMPGALLREAFGG